jgi:hypothetical protein
MADVPDSKSGGVTPVWVQVTPSVLATHGDPSKSLKTPSILDLSSFVIRLLLFDELIVDSLHLEEVEAAGIVPIPFAWIWPGKSVLAECRTGG